MGGHGFCPMCANKNALLTVHHEYFLEKKEGKKIMMCKQCQKNFHRYFTWLEKHHNYKYKKYKKPKKI